MAITLVTTVTGVVWGSTFVTVVIGGTTGGDYLKGTKFTRRVRVVIVVEGLPEGCER